ncbi:LexA family protein [Alkalicoccobacillus plakortidis]|uniref:XRE family transcriptional regulator n=1 Tax=Alkalicoccobacillus plakortidis TaxID=444060 RepID=A0ABT0XI84_9BACI|nr:XRE family transcriptional regulator [Alkalicoccobacillus plakortidis]MCM2675611.1 XRE family transcriptional regulator [Alkalicoccobacillus plakortidis]
MDNFYQIVGANIEKHRKAKKVSAEELGKRIGVTKKTIRRYELGEIRILNDRVLDIAKGLEIDPTELYAGTMNEVKSDMVHEVVNNDYSNITNVPIVGAIAAGAPIFAEQNIEGYLPMMTSFLKQNKTYFYLTVTGDSMDRELPEGSYVLVEKDADIENGQIAVVRVNGYDATVKKVSVSGDIVTLIPLSNNPTHQPHTFNIAEDDIAFIGKVIQSVKTY